MRPRLKKNATGVLDGKGKGGYLPKPPTPYARYVAADFEENATVIFVKNGLGWLLPNPPMRPTRKVPGASESNTAGICDGG